MNIFLYCIDVDDSSWATSNWTEWNGGIDSHSFFSEDCGVK